MAPNLLAKAGTMICSANAYSTGLSLESFDSMIQTCELSSNDLFVNALRSSPVECLVLVEENDGLIDVQELSRIVPNVIKFNSTNNEVLAHTFQDAAMLDKAMRKNY